jgi:hypothetical protein
MRVLLGMECSGTVRDEFLKLGHDAMSCDLKPTRSPGPHYQGDVMDVIDYPWDLAIFHPECTNTAVSGARHFEEKRFDGRQQASVSFFLKLEKNTRHIPRRAFEQPISIMPKYMTVPHIKQIIHPWQHGHGETKATVLYLFNLPELQPTDIVTGRDDRIHKMPPSEMRAEMRSKTYAGIAKAFASQWSTLPTPQVSYEHH